ncbi:MAG: hypothetical protein GY703_10945 [Gammaproteobacteria bacterium]|nr:hypothetical protein [Gammaproteobacteria bacterium]
MPFHKYITDEHTTKPGSHHKITVEVQYDSEAEVDASNRPPAQSTRELEANRWKNEDNK